MKKYTKQIKKYCYFVGKYVICKCNITYLGLLKSNFK